MTREPPARGGQTEAADFADTDDEPRVAVVPVDSVGVEIHAVNVDSALAQALAIRPELAEDAAVIEQRKAEAAFARSGVWPALDLVASYNRFGLAGEQNPHGPQDPIPYQVEGDLGDSFDTLADGDFHSARVGLALELPILNREAKGRSAGQRASRSRPRPSLTPHPEVDSRRGSMPQRGWRRRASGSMPHAPAARRRRSSLGRAGSFRLRPPPTLVLTRQNDLSAARLTRSGLSPTDRPYRDGAARTLIEARGIQVSTEEND